MDILIDKKHGDLSEVAKRLGLTQSHVAKIVRRPRAKRYPAVRAELIKLIKNRV